MKAYRDQYASVEEKGAQVVAVSTDDVDTLKKFKESLAAPFLFLSDPDGKVAEMYGGTMLGHAKRATFVIDRDGKIAHTETGGAAVEAVGAVNACPKGGPKTI